MFQRATLKSWKWPGDEATVLLYYKSVCIYATVAAVIIKIFSSQVKSSRLN